MKSNAYIIPFIWFGMVASISFMEAPLKFQAPNVTLAIGLGIGKLVFGMLNKIENVFLIATFVAILLNKEKNLGVLIMFSVLAILLSLETFVLLPSLIKRANDVIANKPVETSNLHFYYVAIEVVKLMTLFILGLKLAKRSNTNN